MNQKTNSLSAVLFCRLAFCLELGSLLLLLCLGLQAQSLGYVTNNGAITITGGTNLFGALVIPETLGGLPVTAITSAAFQTNRQITSLTLPENLQNVGNAAFFSCTNLSAISFGSRLCTIGSAAFYDCQNLLDAALPQSLTNLGYAAFQECTGLTNVTLGTNLTCLWSNTFAADAALASITIPDSVTNIQDAAFADCRGLTNVSTGNGLRVIGSYAFVRCTNLAGITLGSQLSIIGTNAFAYCAALSSIAIPATITDIAPYAFTYCTNLRAIYFLGAPPKTQSSQYTHAPTMIFYLTGSTDWPAKYWSGYATCLWAPKLETAEDSFGLHNNQFGFTISGSTNLAVLVQASSDLSSPIWTCLLKTNLAAGPVSFSEPLPPDASSRFYRLHWPQ